MKHIPKENIKVNLSVGFLASLQDRHNERYSKHEAFCYLLDKACERYLPKSVKKEVADLLGDFQFITTKTQLAEDWHWHRATVRQFLEKLTEHGLINGSSDKVRGIPTQISTIHDRKRTVCP